MWIVNNDALDRFCGLYPLLSVDGLAGSYTVSNNAVNPTAQDIVEDGPCDSDGDGVPDDVDQCADSDLSVTVWIGDCDSGVPNFIDDVGCTLADLLAEQLTASAGDARNHGQFVRTMAAYLNVLAAADAITQDEQDALMNCIGSADESQFLP